MLEVARGLAPRHERDRSNDCSPPAWRLERVGANDSNPGESPAQGHSPRGNGGDLVDREKQRSTDQPQDPQSPRWQTHGEPNANHNGDKPGEQDPIDNLTNYPTSRGRFELRLGCRPAHAVAAETTSFGLTTSPWSAAGPTHRATAEGRQRCPQVRACHSGSSVSLALQASRKTQSPTRFSTGGHVPSDGMSRGSARTSRQGGGLNGSPQ
jgi:hypothetical protein